MDPSATVPPIVLRLSHFLGPSSFFQTDFAEPWARDLEKSSAGEVKVEICNAASPFGEVTRQAAQVENGTVDIALGLCSVEKDRFPRTSIIELPFVVRDALNGSRAVWNLYKSGGLGDEYAHFKVLALFVHNPGLIHTTVKRIVTPDDMKDQKLRVPNKTIARALHSIGATPAILQVNDVMPAIRNGSLDGVVTNWGNPLPEFNMYLHYHLDVAFYSSAFFVLMNRQRFDSLSPDVQAAIEKLSNEALVTRIGLLWSEWDRPVREGATGSGQHVLVPDEALMEQWRNALQPYTMRYLDELVAGGFSEAPTMYRKLTSAQT